MLGGKEGRKEGTRKDSRTVYRQSEQLLSSRVGGVFSPQLVKLSLETLQSFTGFSWSYALHPRTPADTQITLHRKFFSLMYAFHRLPCFSLVLPVVVLAAEALSVALEVLHCRQQVGLHAGLDLHQSVLVLDHLKPQHTHVFISVFVRTLVDIMPSTTPEFNPFKQPFEE